MGGTCSQDNKDKVPTEHQPATARSSSKAGEASRSIMHGAMKSSSGTSSPRELNRRVSFQNGTEDYVDSKIAKIKEISMKKIVDGLYAKVLADPLLSPFYEGINMARLKHQQEKVMMLAFGGPELVKDEAPDMDMRKIHWKQLSQGGLNFTHWDAFVGHFEHTLNEMPEVPSDVRIQACNLIRSTHDMFAPPQPGEVH